MSVPCTIGGGWNHGLAPRSVILPLVLRPIVLRRTRGGFLNDPAGVASLPLAASKDGATIGDLCRSDTTPLALGWRWIGQVATRAGLDVGKSSVGRAGRATVWRHFFTAVPNLA